MNDINDSSGNYNQNLRTKRLRFALEGLSCSSCVMTVTDALKSFSFSHPTGTSSHTLTGGDQEKQRNMSNVTIEIHKDTLKVSLLPDPNLELTYTMKFTSPSSQRRAADGNGNYDNIASNDEEYEEAIESNLINDIIDLVDSIGFEAELTSSIELKHDSEVKDDEEIGHVKHEEIIDDPLRSLYLTIKSNANVVHEILTNIDHVHTVKYVNQKMKKKKYNETYNLHNNISNGITMDSATIEISYDCNEIGIRTIISMIESNPTLLSKGGCGSPIEVTDVSSYQNMIAKSEERRQLEINKFFQAFLISACCAIPVAFISMVFVHVPGMKQSLHSYVFWNITWEEFITWLLTTPVQFYSGARFYREAYYSIKSRHLGMGFLIATGTTAAYFYSVFVVFYNASRNAVMGDRLMQAFETSALLIMFVLLGKYLECKVKAFTSKAVSKLSQLTPESATLVGSVTNHESSTCSSNVTSLPYDPVPEQQIPLILLQMNDVLLIRPGEKVPADGIVIQGATSIDESMLTGESMPKHIEKEDNVIGGTINIDGSIYIKVNAIGKDTALSKIIGLIEAAQSSKAPIQDFADNIAAKFVPAVTATALFTYFLWAVLLNTSALDGVKETWPYKEEGLNEWTLPLLFSISCLVIACPCALGLATPTAVMVGSGVSAKHGILIKGGETLEAANKISAVVFDKTGTLTYGAPVVQEVLLLSDRCAFLSSSKDDSETMATERNSWSEPVDRVSTVLQVNDKALRTILRFAACAENGSEHPLAKGILTKAAELSIGEGLDQAENFIVEVGSGIKCTIDGHEVVVGNRRSLQKNVIDVTDGTFLAMEFLEKRGQTAVVVSVDGKSEAVVGLIDKARDESAQVIAALRDKMGIKAYMLTGDNERTARVVAADIGIHPDYVISDVLPKGKVACIKQLQERGENVAMIGDGVNDSPAMAQANVGIAIGAGTDVAIETAGIVLMNSKLTDVLVAIDLSRKVFHRIKLNFVWALGYNTLAIPIAAGALYPVLQMALPPFMAAVAMILSSLSVLTSSLLLNLYKVDKYTYRSDSIPESPSAILEDVNKSGNVMVYASAEVASMCKSMLEGGMCSCSPEYCNCQGCTIHSKAIRNDKDLIYPGCGELWKNGCNCQPCHCGVSCSSTNKK